MSDTATQSGSIGFEVKDAVAHLRLSNPARRNAISVGMWRRLARLAAEISGRGDIRVVLLRGEGDVSFSAGADISGFEAARSSGEVGSYDDLVEETLGALEAIAQPTIALIKGTCFGAGASVAASCDLRIAGEGASFAVPAARLGLGYDPRGVARFARIFGQAATATLLFVADRLSAPRAHALGAVQFLLPDAAVDEAAEALAARIASNAPLTLHAAKLAIRALTHPELLTPAIEATRAADASADYREGRAAFLDKRLPKFLGL